jgi:hypothetical protein
MIKDKVMGFIRKSIASASVKFREFKVRIDANKSPRVRLNKFIDHLENDPDIWVAQLRNLLNALPDELIFGCVEKDPLALLIVFNADDFVAFTGAVDSVTLRDAGMVLSRRTYGDGVPEAIVRDHLMKMAMFAFFVMHGETDVKPNGNDVSASLADIFILIENSFGDRVSRSAWLGERVN